MKYGIQAKYENGDVMYVSSTRHRNPALTDDITDAALFVQEQSAIDAVKVIRKDGYEPEGATLKVVGIVFKVETITLVPYPKTKTGFIIEDPEPMGYHNDELYYTGTKKAGKSWGQYRMFGNIERATVFDSESQAQKRITELLTDAEESVQDEKNRPPPHYYSDPNGEQRAQQQKDRSIAQAESKVARIKRVKIVSYP